jgi:D-alanyl-D-alanine carboxypeptidase/D-alanyl-D-alanine-endopeptidase (penicillin-binding protein 4)
VVVAALLGPGNITTAGAASMRAETPLCLGPREAIRVTAPDGRVVLAIHQHTPLMPASTLKLLTVLTVFDALGPEYRFETVCYRRSTGDLVIHGTGDPLLISEILDTLAAQLADRMTDKGIHKSFRDIILDDSYFQGPLAIPGVGTTTNPYDAPVGALCVNFNTVAFRMVDGGPVSAEPQTPLIPFAEERIRRLRPKTDGRIVLTHNHDDALLYAGYLLRAFLAEHCIAVTGRIRRGRVDPARDRELLRFQSPFSVATGVTKLLHYSNNFMANQLLIAAGAKVYGPPGTLEKGVRLLGRFAREHLGILDGVVSEGSGIARTNRMTAAGMDRVLKRFLPYREMLRSDEDGFYKTGTLDHVRARVGFIDAGGDGVYSYVILLNSGNGSADRYLPVVQRAVDRDRNIRSP